MSALRFNISELAEPGQIALAALDALSSRVCVIDESGQMMVTNEAWRAFAASGVCNASSCAGTCCQILSMPRRMAAWAQDAPSEVRQGVHELLAGKCRSFSHEYECFREESRRVFSMRGTRLPSKVAIFLITHDDITERRQAEEAQLRSEKRVKQLGAHMESLREEQSARIARELHDELGASLSMLKLELTLLAKKVAKTQSLYAKFDELLDRADGALQSVKRISSNLRPAMLDVLGLTATIRWYVERFSHSSGIATELDLPDYIRLSDVSGIAIFRIIQEGLTNVAKHSGATRLVIGVRKQEGVLILEIADNGKGVSDADLRRANSFGVIGMQERAQYLGGTLAISGKPGKGTRLVVQIPLDD